MRRVEFVVILDDGVRRRHIHEAERGIVQTFAVQLEVWMADWRFRMVRQAHHKFWIADAGFRMAESYYYCAGNILLILITGQKYS